jgi:outer membrane protein assembly factor BamB
VGLASTVVFAACDWTSYLDGASHSSFNPGADITAANASTLTKVWTWTPDAATRPGQPSAGLYASPSVAHGRIYLGSNTGDFYAISESTGTVVWKRFIGFQPSITCMAIGFVSTASVVDEPDGHGGTIPVVYVASPDGYLYALNGNDGSIRWRSLVVLPSTTTNDAFNWSSPTVFNDRIYLGFSSNCDTPFIRGGVKMFDKLTGANLATWYGVPDGSKGGGVWTSVAADDTAVYASTGSADPGVTADSNSIVKLDAATLQELAVFHPPASDLNAAGDPDFGSSPIRFAATLNGVLTDLVGACNKDGFFYALRTSDMSLVWKRKVGTATADGGDACIGNGAFDGDRLFLPSNNTTLGTTAFQGAVRSLDPATGNTVWERGLSANVPGAISLNGGDVLVAATHDFIPSGLPQHAYLLNASTGDVIRTLDNNNAKEFSQPTFVDDYLLLPTSNHVYAYKLP